MNIFANRYRPTADVRKQRLTPPYGKRNEDLAVS